MKCRRFTEAEVDQIIERYPDEPAEAIAKSLNRPVYSIYGKANLLGIKKSPDFMKSKKSGRLQKGSALGKEFQFQKGHTSFNKGLKLDEFMSPETVIKFKKNQFKKGNKPHNTKYDGYECIIDGYVHVRISLGIKKPKHRLVWEDLNGIIPKGHNVFFKNGNRLDFDINNLILLSDKELMGQNTIGRYPKELQTSIRALAKINKKINNHGKKQNV